MNNSDRLVEYLRNNNGTASYSNIRLHFGWKSNYLNELIKKLGTQVLSSKQSISGKEQMGGKRFEKYLTTYITDIQPEVITEVQYGSIDTNQVLEKIRQTKIKVYRRLIKKDKYLWDTITEVLRSETYQI